MRTSDLKMNLELPIGRLDTTKRHLQNHQLPKTLNLSVFCCTSMMISVIITKEQQLLHFVLIIAIFYIPHFTNLMDPVMDLIVLLHTLGDN